MRNTIPEFIFHDVYGTDIQNELQTVENLFVKSKEKANLIHHAINQFISEYKYSFQKKITIIDPSF